MFSYSQPRRAMTALERLVCIFTGTISVALRLECGGSHFQAYYRQQSVPEFITFVLVIV
jgi:hypothetical protein